MGLMHTRSLTDEPKASTVATLMTKVRRVVKRRVPGLSVRRFWCEEGNVYFSVQVMDGPRLESLGNCDVHLRDEVFALCLDGGYSLDEVVSDKTWLLKREKTA